MPAAALSGVSADVGKQDGAGIPKQYVRSFGNRTTVEDGIGAGLARELIYCCLKIVFTTIPVAP